MRADDLPLWVFGLVTQIEQYEETHAGDAHCLLNALALVPDDVRTTAAVLHRQLTENGEER